MKTYTKPSLNAVDIRVEERFAGGSSCTVTGSCPTSGSNDCISSYNSWLAKNGYTFTVNNNW